VVPARIGGQPNGHGTRVAARRTVRGWYLDFGQRVADGNVDEARQLLAEAHEDFDRIRSPLPDRPDEAPVQAWLLRVRAAFLSMEVPT
jgi:uncharacterized protein